MDSVQGLMLLQETVDSNFSNYNISIFEKNEVKFYNLIF